MKEIKAFIRTNMIDYVIDALENLEHAPGITLSDVRGWGHAKEKDSAQLVKRVKLETVVPDNRVDAIVSLITDKAHTGNFGDGKIFISEVKTAIRIRTGETDVWSVKYSDMLINPIGQACRRDIQACPSG